MHTQPITTIVFDEPHLRRTPEEAAEHFGHKPIYDGAELALQLEQFNGTNQWWPLGGRMRITDGVMYFAECAGSGARWFLNIVSAELMPINGATRFIHIEMAVKDTKALIRADDGNDGELWLHEVDVSDCPEGKWKFFLVSGALMLPSEY